MENSNPFRGTITDIDLRLLRIFTAIVECGGITPAAIEINLDRSTVSKHLADLETRFGIRLCERGRHGFALTPAGERVYRATKHLLGTIGEFSSEIAGIHGYLSGVLSIAFADGVLKNPEARIDQTLQRFHDAAPDVHLKITISSANEIERGITEGRYNAGIVPFHHAIEGMDHEYVFTEDARLYCGEAHPLFGKDDDEISLGNLKYAAYVDWGYFVDTTAIDGRIEFTPKATVYNNEGAAMLILSGYYIGFLPVHYADQWQALGKMRSLLPEVAYYRKPMALIHKKVFADSLLVTKFVECLRQAHRSVSA